MDVFQRSEKQRFVLQQHRTADGVHWDLMIHIGQALWTWRMPCFAADIGDTPVPLEKIADHPLRFLTYEGPVQHNTGQVNIADTGTVAMLEHTQHAITAHFDGHYLNGHYRLKRNSDGPLWTLACVDDAD